MAPHLWKETLWHRVTLTELVWGCNEVGCKVSQLLSSMVANSTAILLFSIYACVCMYVIIIKLKFWLRNSEPPLTRVHPVSLKPRRGISSVSHSSGASGITGLRSALSSAPGLPSLKPGQAAFLALLRFNVIKRTWVTGSQHPSGLIFGNLLFHMVQIIIKLNSIHL